jgi:hypothetical protein
MCLDDFYEIVTVRPLVNFSRAECIRNAAATAIVAAHGMDAQCLESQGKDVIHDRVLDFKQVHRYIQHLPLFASSTVIMKSISKI